MSLSIPLLPPPELPLWPPWPSPCACPSASPGLPCFLPLPEPQKTRPGARRSRLLGRNGPVWAKVCAAENGVPAGCCPRDANSSHGLPSSRMSNWNEVSTGSEATGSRSQAAAASQVFEQQRDLALRDRNEQHLAQVAARGRGIDRPREAVAHVWLINPAAQTLEVYRREGARWLLVDTFGEAERVRAESFDAIELDLSLLWAG